MEVLFRVHALERMFERGIKVGEVRQAVEGGETLERYPGEASSPGRLVLSGRGKKALHVVAAGDGAECVVITAYRPDPARWTDDYRQRRDEVPDL